MAEEVKTAAAEGESGSKNFIDAFIEEDKIGRASCRERV